MAVTLCLPSAGWQGLARASWAGAGQPQHPLPGCPGPPAKLPYPGGRAWRATGAPDSCPGVALPYWWLLAGSCDRDHAGAGQLCPVCLQPPSQPATRHPEPCARLPGASQSGTPFAVSALTPGSANTEAQTATGGGTAQIWAMSPLMAATQRAGKSHHPRDVLEDPEEPQSSRSLQPSSGSPQHRPCLTVPLRASISQV